MIFKLLNTFSSDKFHSSYYSYSGSYSPSSYYSPIIASISRLAAIDAPPASKNFTYALEACTLRTIFIKSYYEYSVIKSSWLQTESSS